MEIMKNKCPYCERRIWGLIFPNQKWLGMELYPRKDKGACPHCKKPIILNSRYLKFHFLGWLCFAMGMPLPFFFSNSFIDSYEYRLFFLVLFIVLIMVSFCVQMYDKNPDNDI